jgi:hypothetical protein
MPIVDYDPAKLTIAMIEEIMLATGQRANRLQRAVDDALLDELGRRARKTGERIEVRVPELAAGEVKRMLERLQIELQCLEIARETGEARDLGQEDLASGIDFLRAVAAAVLKATTPCESAASEANLARR